MLATLERLRRKGLLRYESFMSIELNAANAIVLDREALARSGENLGALRRSLH